MKCAVAKYSGPNGLQSTYHRGTQRDKNYSNIFVFVYGVWTTRVPYIEPCAQYWFPVCCLFYIGKEQLRTQPSIYHGWLWFMLIAVYEKVTFSVILFSCVIQEGVISNVWIKAIGRFTKGKWIDHHVWLLAVITRPWLLECRVPTTWNSRWFHAMSHWNMVF